MKKYYKYGEILLALREEFKQYKQLLEQLGECINIKDDYEGFWAHGTLGYNVYSPTEKTIIKSKIDSKILLSVERKYSDILKLIKALKYGEDGKDLYISTFSLKKGNAGLYEFKHQEPTNSKIKEEYRPEVEITAQEKVASIADKILSSDFMKLNKTLFTNNNDAIGVDFSKGYIFGHTRYGGETYLDWDGTSDLFNYGIEKHVDPSVIEELLYLNMPTYRIPDEWLELLEKHLDRKLSFEVDESIIRKIDTLKISEEQNNSIVRLMREEKKKNR